MNLSEGCQHCGNLLKEKTAKEIYEYKCAANETKKIYNAGACFLLGTGNNVTLIESCPDFKPIINLNYEK